MAPLLGVDALAMRVVPKNVSTRIAAAHRLAKLRAHIVAKHVFQLWCSPP